MGEAGNGACGGGGGESFRIDIVVLGRRSFVFSLSEVGSLAEERDGSNGALVLEVSGCSVDRVVGSVGGNGINGGVGEAGSEARRGGLKAGGGRSAIETLVEARLRREGVLWANLGL